MQAGRGGPDGPDWAVVRKLRVRLGVFFGVLLAASLVDGARLLAGVGAVASRGLKTARAAAQPPAGARGVRPSTHQPGVRAVGGLDAQRLDALALDVYSAQLDNGLRLLVVPWPSPGVVTYATLVRVGSRDEAELGHSGYAHLLSHVAYAGTPRVSADRYAAEMERLGAHHRSIVTDDYTMYTVVVPKRGLADVVAMEGDRVAHVFADELAYRAHIEAVASEYQWVKLWPGWSMREALRRLAFARHPYGHTVLGQPQDIDRMPEEYAYAQSFFRKFYTPDNTVVLAVGDVRPEAALSLVRSAYRGWRGHRARSRVLPELPPKSGGHHRIAWPRPVAAQLLVGYRIPAFISGLSPAERAAALRVSAALRAARAMAWSPGSPLRERLSALGTRMIEQPGAGEAFLRDPGLLRLGLLRLGLLRLGLLRLGLLQLRTVMDGVEDARPRADAVVAAIQRAWVRLSRADFAAELVRAKAHLRRRLLSHRRDPARVAALLGRVCAVADDVAALDLYAEALSQLTPADVRAATARFLTPQRRFVVELVPAPGAEL